MYLVLLSEEGELEYKPNIFIMWLVSNLDFCLTSTLKHMSVDLASEMF